MLFQLLAILLLILILLYLYHKIFKSRKLFYKQLNFNRDLLREAVHSNCLSKTTGLLNSVPNSTCFNKYCPHCKQRNGLDQITCYNDCIYTNYWSNT